MALPDDINMASHRIKFPLFSTNTLKTRLDPFKYHRQLFSHPPSSSSPPSSIPHPHRTNMFTTPTKATSRFTPATTSPARTTFRMRASGLLFTSPSPSPYNGPGGRRPMELPTLLQSIRNSSPFATPLRRRYTPTRFQSPPGSPPRTSKSHRGRVPAQSLPRKERSFQSLEKPVAPSAKPAVKDDATFSDLTSKVNAAKSKFSGGPEAEIFFVQLGKLDEIRSLTKDLMKARISAPDASPVPNFEATHKARKERRRAEARKATQTPEPSSPQKREALFSSQRKKLREEALHREEQEREPEDPVAGSSQERTRLSLDSANNLKRKQQAKKAGDVFMGQGDMDVDRAKTTFEENAARQRREEEAAFRERAQQAAAKQRKDEGLARLRAAEEEFAARRKQEELEHQERLARAQAARAREEEEARRLAADNEMRRKLAEELRKKEMEDEARRQARQEEEERIAREEEVLRKAEAHARWRMQEQKEQKEKLERLAREQATEEARIKAEQARIDAENAHRAAEKLAQQARFEAEQTRRFAEEQARIRAEEQARLAAEQEEKRRALAAEEARIRAIAEAVAQMEADLNRRAQEAFGAGASWHNPHEFYEFKRFQEQRQQQEYQQQQQYHHQQSHPSPEFQHQQPFFEQQQQQQYYPQEQQQHYERQHHDTDIPMREPSLADINMDGPEGSTPHCPEPEPTPPPPPPPPPPPVPLTKDERVQAYWVGWKARMAELQDSPLPINFNQIPWPVAHEVEKPEDVTVEHLLEFYTHHYSQFTQKDFKKMAHVELKKWHSDKFSAKFKDNFDYSRPMILETANIITRFLIEVLSKK